MQIGILGFAHGHVNQYCAEWGRHPEWGVQVAAGWDHDAQRLQKAAARYGLRPMGSAQELLVSDVQAVVISAETAYHAALTEQAAAASKAIIVQKPLALTIPEGERMLAAVRRYGVPFTLAWQMRADPQNAKIKELLQSGQLGKVFMVRRRHGLGVHLIPTFTSRWHVVPELNRDIWADDAAHAIDFIHWLLGVPETVTAEILSINDPKMPMDNGVALFRYPGGPLAEVSCSFTCPAAENTTEVWAAQGSIIQNYGDGPSCDVPRPADACGLKWYSVATREWTCSDIPSPSGHSARVDGLSWPLAEFLHGRRPPIATAEEGLTTLRMTLACYLSVREGRRVRLDDPAIATL